MVDLYSSLAAGLAFFIVAVSPGPANISNAAIAMSQGRRISLVYGTGLSFGLVFWGLIAASGLGVVLQSSVHVLMVIKVLGGLYLLWLAYLSAKDAVKPNNQQAEKHLSRTSQKTWFIRGLILNISNPKTVLAWMAALSVGIDANNGVYSLLTAVAVCIIVGFATNAMYSLVFSFRGVMGFYSQSSRLINSMTASLFAISGIGLIRSAFTRNPA